MSEALRDIINQMDHQIREYGDKAGRFGNEKDGEVHLHCLVGLCSAYMFRYNQKFGEDNGDS